MFRQTHILRTTETKLVYILCEHINYITRLYVHIKTYTLRDKTNEYIIKIAQSRLGPRHQQQQRSRAIGLHYETINNGSAARRRSWMLSTLKGRGVHVVNGVVRGNEMGKNNEN